MPAEQMILPESVGPWKAAGPPRRIDESNIFAYMNGGGELYLAYRFDHMLAWEYRDDGGNDITVEAYRMQASDDAFGLLSLDWGGEMVPLAPDSRDLQAISALPPARALYGAGLLRLWAGDLYARVMAVRETDEAKQAILELGRIIAAGRPLPAPPALPGILPAGDEGEWKILPDRTVFFRSHLVLNSFYYLSHENLLGLGSSCAAAFATYQRQGERGHLLVIQYADSAAAAQGLQGFLRAYLPEAGKDEPFCEVEDGWLGFRSQGRSLALALAFPDRASAQEILGRVALAK